jgi:hypothetical protein
MLVQIPGTDLYRDTETMALINKDVSGLEEYNMKRRMLMTQKSEINKVKSEINGIKEEMTEIKSLLLKLLDKGSNG